MDPTEARRILERGASRGAARSIGAARPRSRRSRRRRSRCSGARLALARCSARSASLPDRRAPRARPADQRGLRRAPRGRSSARRAELEQLGEDALLRADAVDVTLPGRRPRPGSLHPLTHRRGRIVEIFTRMGYRVAEGPEIEDEWHNFEALNIPPDHPARTMKDSLYVDVPGLLLRTETSAVQIRTMESQAPPVYVIVPGRVYRREAVGRHAPVGLPSGRGARRRRGDLVRRPEGHARGVRPRDVRRAASACGSRPTTSRSSSPAARRRCRASSATASAAACAATAGSSCSAPGWCIPKVLENCGYDSERYTGFAFGWGIERVAMVRYGVDDMRLLVEGDVRFLEQFEGAA